MAVFANDYARSHLLPDPSFPVSHVEILAKDESEEVLISNKVQATLDQEETAVGSHYVNIQIKFN